MVGGPKLSHVSFGTDPELKLVASPFRPSTSDVPHSESDMPSSEDTDSLFTFSSNDALPKERPPLFALSKARTTENNEKD